jgi:hypothetical protein
MTGSRIWRTFEMLLETEHCSGFDLTKFKAIASELSKRYGDVPYVEVATWYGPQYVRSDGSNGRNEIDLTVRKIDLLFQKLLTPVKFGNAIFENTLEEEILLALKLPQILKVIEIKQRQDRNSQILVTI